MARVLALASILVFVGSVSASAQEADASTREMPGYARSGFYIAANIGGVAWTGVTDEVRQALSRSGVDGITVNTDASASLGVRGGYRFLPRLAGEVQLEWLSEASASVTGNTEFPGGMTFDGSEIYDFDGWSATANVKGYVLTGQVQPYLMVGLGVLSIDAKDRLGIGLPEDETGLVGRIGGGVDYNFTETIYGSFEVSYMQPILKTDLRPFTYVVGSVGIGYRF